MALLVDELDGGKEEVEQESPLGGIEFVELSNKVLLVKSFIAEILSDVSPVFPLDMSVIVFLVFSGPGVVNRATAMNPIFEHGPVQELTTIVAVEAPDLKGKSLLNGFEGLESTRFTFSPDGSLFSPSSGDIDRIDGKNEHSGS